MRMMTRNGECDQSVLFEVSSRYILCDINLTIRTSSHKGSCKKKSAPLHPQMAADFDLQPSAEKKAIFFSKNDDLTHNPLRKKNTVGVPDFFWNSPM